MPLDWLNAPREKSLGDLIARRRYSKAIEVLKAQILRRTPTTQARLQLADLLVLAGRGPEAVPILVALADEFAADGFVAKAVAVLKRVDRIEPGRDDVESRLATLVKLQRRPTSSGPLPTLRRRLPEFGIEEIGPEPPVAAAATEPIPPAEPPAVAEPTPSPESVPAPVMVAAPAHEPAPPAAPEPAAETPLPGPQPTMEAESAASPDGTNRRIRSVFRRFLASFAGGPQEDAGKDGTEPLPSDAATGPSTDGAALAAAVVEVSPTPEAPAVPEPMDTAVAPPEPEPAPLPPSEPPVVETAAAAVEVAPEVSEAEPEAVAAEPAPAEPALAEAAQAEAMSAEAAPDETEPTEAAPAETGPGEPGETVPGDTEQPGVTGRIRGAFRRFLTTITGGPETGDQPSTDASEPGTGEPAAQAAIVDAETTSHAKIPVEGERAPEEIPGPGELPADAEAAADAEPPLSEEAFQEQVLDVIQDALTYAAPTADGAATVPAPTAPELPAFAGPILASPLFDDLSEDELLAVVHGLELHTHEAGDVIVTEGEHGDSLYILTTGAVKVFVRNPAGRNLEVGRMGEGEFFGEISSLSGRPRTATITAALRCELLELDKRTVESVARKHPRVREMLEAYYIRRASSPEAAAIRAVNLGDPRTRQQAVEALEAYFGGSRWDPRMRLRLAEVLLKAGKDEDAVPVLIGLADDLVREGFTEKGIAILKKVEKIQHRHLEEINLAPLGGGGPKAPRRVDAPPSAPAVLEASGVPQPKPATRAPRAGATEAFFQGWIVDVLRERVNRTQPVPAAAPGPWLDPARVGAYAHGLRASPLFEGFSEEELLAVIQGLRLLAYEPGDIVVSEGEPGESLFVLAVGSVKVFVRNPSGHNVGLSSLGEGAFFGEISTLSSRPRTATVVASAHCELLELERAVLEGIARTHPRVRVVLEECYIERASSPEAARIRGTTNG